MEVHITKLYITYATRTLECHGIPDWPPEGITARQANMAKLCLVQVSND